MADGTKVPNEDFALGFQPDGVQLLHHTGSGWTELSRVSFDADLREGLDDFSRRLRAANASGLALIIPEDQIFYADLELPPAATTEEALNIGLDGLTPYSPRDLAVDFTPAGAMPGTEVKIAAVARQTLQEAEDFAVRHGFAPDRFVAAPLPDQFPHIPDFGATDLAAEWTRAADLTQLSGTDDTQPEQEAIPGDRPEPASIGPVLSRITPHIVISATDATGPVVAETRNMVQVNIGSIILPDDKLAEVQDSVPETGSEEVSPEAVSQTNRAGSMRVQRRAGPMSDRARAFHERAVESRKIRPVAAPAPRMAATAAGRRSGLSGALPMVGILVLGLGIAAVLTSRDPAPENVITDSDTPAISTAEIAGNVVPPSSDIMSIPSAMVAETGQTAALDGVSVPSASSGLPIAGQADRVLPGDAHQAGQIPGSADVAARDVTTVPVTEPAVVPSVDAGNTAAARPEETVDPLTGAGAPAVAAGVAAVGGSMTIGEGANTADTTAGASVQVVSQPPASEQPRLQPVDRATSRAVPAITSSTRPTSRPANLARGNSRQSPAPEPEPASAQPVVRQQQQTTAPVQANSNRPVSRPVSRGRASSAAATTSNRQRATPAPGAPASTTLQRSARPQSAPARSVPAASSAVPDPQPAVPRSPQPYGQREQPEPPGSRPPPRPADMSSAQGAALHMQPAPRHMVLFSVAGHEAMLARLDNPWLPQPEVMALPLVRTAQARPTKRPTRSDAVDSAVAEAMGSSERPAARASTVAGTETQPTASQPAPAVTGQGEASSGKLARSNRPQPRPGSGVGQSASTSGLSEVTDAAVEEAIASAVSASSAAPGSVKLSALRSSVRPQKRGAPPAGGKNSATDDAVSAAMADQGKGTDGTLAPEPVQDGAASKAEAEAAALAERRRLDQELQRQAEQRVRERAAADARAAAQAKAAAEARARAQAEAEAAAAARKNQTYRPPEVDDEPEVQSKPSGTTSKSVANAATVKGIDLNATQLIGTVGAGKASRGLVRLSNGRIVTVRLGDKINGGKITSIGNGGLKYTRSGKQYNLPILNGR
ncbi:MAG: hypothetical protein ACK5II_11795 [Paracoccus sp. (in: a-proteobacteria)]